MSLLQKQFIALITTIALVVSGCNLSYPERSDWCYLFDFVQNDQGFGLSKGNWQLGAGFVADDSGQIAFSYVHGSIVEPTGVRILAQRWPGSTGTIYVNATSVFFGNEYSIDNQPLNPSTEIFPIEIGTEGNGGTALNVSMVASQTTIIRSIEIRGNGTNPFPYSSCNPDSTNTPTVQPVTVTASTSATQVPSTSTATITPSLTATPTVTPSWSPTASPDWCTTFDFSISDGGWANQTPMSRPFGTWSIGTGWNSVWGSVAGFGFDERLYIYREIGAARVTSVIITYSALGSFGTSPGLGVQLWTGAGLSRDVSQTPQIGTDRVRTYIFDNDASSIRIIANGGQGSINSSSLDYIIHSVYVSGSGTAPSGITNNCSPVPTATPSATTTPTTVEPTATQTHDPTLITNTPSGGGGATATSGPVISTTPVVGDTEWECTFNFALGQQGWIANQSIETVYSAGAWRNARTPNSLTAIRFNLNQSIILTYLQVIGSSNKARGDAPARGFRAGTNPIVISLFGWDSEDNGAYDVSWSGHMGIHEPYLLVSAGTRGIAGTTTLTIGQIVMRAFAATRPANNCTTNSIGPMPTFDQTYFITATPMPGQTLLPLPTAFPTFALTPSGTGEPGGGGTIGDGEDTCNGDILCIISNLISAFISMIGNFLTTIINIASVFFDLIVMAFRSLFDFIGMILNLISVLFQIAWGLLQQLFHFLAEVWEIIKLIFSIIWKLLQLAAAWIGQLVSSLQSIFYAWYLAPAQAIPFLPQCSTNPMANDVCAVYYVLNHTFFSGSIGMLLIPMLMLLMNLAMIIYFARNVKTILEKVGSIFR